MATGEQEHRAFSELFAAAHRRVWAYAVRGGASPADADDLVADVFVVAWRRLPEIPTDDPVPWLLAVARNVRRNQLRSGRRSDALVERLRTEPSSVAEAPTRVQGEILAMRRALAALSDADREVIQLAAVEELSPSQIAQVLGCRPVTARVRLHRARGRLRALLADTSTVQPTADVTTERSGS